MDRITEEAEPGRPRANADEALCVTCLGEGQAGTRKSLIEGMVIQLVEKEKGKNRFVLIAHELDICIIDKFTLRDSSDEQTE